MIDQLFAPSFSKADYSVGLRTSGESHGVVMTKPHIVSLILDMAGYLPENRLEKLTLLEPSCGKGAFVIEAANRLIQSVQKSGLDPTTLTNSIFATDLDHLHVDETKSNLRQKLVEWDLDSLTADMLVESWIVESDFLLQNFHHQTFDIVVGNPPYIRIEQLSRPLLAEYRCRFESMSDRADLYVPFIEKSLSLLKPKGSLTFICADRWTTNKYGARLRKFITRNYGVRTYIHLDHDAGFETEVSAYPAIFTVANEPQTTTRVIQLGNAEASQTETLARAFRSGMGLDASSTLYPTWFQGDEPWIMIGPDHLDSLKSLESRFQPLEETGDTRIRIGIATGADKVYIVDREIDIEPSRLVPLLQRRDLQNGRTHQPEKCVINTSEPSGKTINLDDYPRLKKYFEANLDHLKRRHVAVKDPERWFKTIDRLHDVLVTEQKLIIPDIAGSTEVFLEEGKSYPHHNLYFITSTNWNLEVLGGLLSSRVALFFIWSYAVKMRGGYLRFQAQYLRKIRVPQPKQIPPILQRKIAKAFRARDFIKLDDLSITAYGLDALPEFPFKDTRY